MVFRDDDPCYTISVVARLVGVHAQTLRYYEREGLVEPLRSRGNIRLYSNHDVERVREIKEWIEELGLNLAGVATMTRLRAQVRTLRSEVAALRDESAALRRDLVALRAGPGAFRALGGEAVESQTAQPERK